MITAKAHHAHGVHAWLPFVPASFHVTPAEGFWAIIAVALIVIGPRVVRSIF